MQLAGSAYNISNSGSILTNKHREKISELYRIYTALPVLLETEDFGIYRQKIYSPKNEVCLFLDGSKFSQNFLIKS